MIELSAGFELIKSQPSRKRQIMKREKTQETDIWHFCCTFTPSNRNPYRLYRTWYDMGNHRKMIAEYANFESVLYHLLQMQLPEFRKDVF